MQQDSICNIATSPTMTKMDSEMAATNADDDKNDGFRVDFRTEIPGVRNDRIPMELLCPPSPPPSTLHPPPHLDVQLGFVPSATIVTP